MNQINPENNMAMFMQEMMQVFMKHHNLNSGLADQSTANNVMLKHLGAAAAEFNAGEEKRVIEKRLKKSSFDRSVKHRVKYLVSFLGADKLVCDIKEVDADGLINSKNEHPYEREQLRKLANKMFDDFVNKFYTLSNPFLNIKKQKLQQSEIVIIPNNHLTLIKENIKSNYTKKRAEFYIDFITLLEKLALRPGELAAIIKRNILLMENEARAMLQITTTKNYKNHLVPVAGDAYKILVKYYHKAKTFDDYLFPGRIILLKDENSKPIKDDRGKYKTKHSHFSVDTISKVFKTACKNLNLPSNYCLYALRATCASKLYTAGLPLQEISRFLNHSNTQVTEKYYSRFTSVNNENLIRILTESENKNLNNNVANNELRKVV